MTSSADLRPLVLCGPSGSGKSTLMKKLMNEFEGKFGFSVSHTTRSPRPGEVDGRDYHFSSRNEMEKMIESGEFIENAEFSGNLYGTSKKSVQDILDSGKICILDIDVQGVKTVKSTDLDPIFVFLSPPSLDILETRLRDRGTETEEAIQKRLSSAAAEMSYGLEPGNFDKIVVNDDLETAYNDLREFILPEIEKIGL